MFKRFHCVRQRDGSDCGAAALATIARQHGRPFGLETMRELAGTDRAGTNLLGLVHAAERIGFAAKAVKGEFEALDGAPLPAIAHVKTAEGYGHFVVLHRVRGDGVVVADPARGVASLSREAFCATWTGYLLLLTPDEAAGGCDQAAHATNRPAVRLWGLLRPHRGVLGEAFVCALLMTLLGVTISYFVQHLVDSVLVRGETALLNAFGVGMALVVLFKTLFGVLRHYLLAYVGRKVDLSLIAGYARHILTLPMSFFEMRQVGEILSRVNDAAKVREAVSGAALTAVVDGVVVAMTMGVLWIYDVQLALAATLAAPLLVVATLAHHPAARRRSRQAMEHAASLSAHLVEDISGVETIKAYGSERARSELGEARLVGLVESVFSLQKLSISMGAVGGMISGLAGIVVLWYGGHGVIDGRLTIGELMFFYTLLGYVLEPLERLATVNLQFQDAAIAVDRLYQVLDLAGERRERGRAQFDGIREAVELRGVGFRYGCRAKVLDDVSLTIRAGATVAIVGESGCGKSTLLKLLTRFYDPAEGQVLVDGVDLRDFDLDSLRRQIGVVSQEPFIFNATLRENIAAGDPDADLNAIAAAARAAGLDEFVNRLPERFDTMLGERGANLSGGERQRLAIARALLRKPALLVFDEATSHLDTSTERAIQENLRSVFADRSVLLVAHRLSTIRDADVIYVMHRGRIVEHGDHESLMAAGGRYAELWRAQNEKALTVVSGPAVVERIHPGAAALAV
ncbi:MAG: peptidase domain-containing ABC transporter [Pirellulales bacterium]|nr:peptidase domain-containing ABC transporter [Pirellulales bacterium]